MPFCFSKDGAVLLHATQKTLLLLLLLSKFAVLPFGSSFIDDTIYAEKLIFLKEGQYSPNHFHWNKMEDIINRCGGVLLIRVFNSLPDESVDRSSDVTVHLDGRTVTVPAGTQVRLEEGMSISIQPGLYHDFSVEPGSGDIIIGEVSQCNDDNTDNRFCPPVGRFPAIEEDEPPYRLLCNEYPQA